MEKMEKNGKITTQMPLDLWRIIIQQKVSPSISLS